MRACSASAARWARAGQPVGLWSHGRTNLDVIRMFSPARISVTGDRDDVLAGLGG